MTTHAPAATLAEVAPGSTARVWVADVSRGLAAAAVLLSADIHYDLWYADGYRDIATIGPLFLLNAVGGLIIGVAITAWRHWLPNLLAAGFGIATLAGFYLSVTVGLFGLNETASGEPQLLAEVSEYAAIVFGALAAALLWRRSRAK